MSQWQTHSNTVRSARKAETLSEYHLSEYNDYHIDEFGVSYIKAYHIG